MQEGVRGRSAKGGPPVGSRRRRRERGTAANVLLPSILFFVGSAGVDWLVRQGGMSLRTGVGVVAVLLLAPAFAVRALYAKGHWIYRYAAALMALAYVPRMVMHLLGIP